MPQNRVDIKEKTRLLNEFIQQNKGKTFTRTELKDHLKCVTSGAAIFNELAKLFPSERIGRASIYEMPKEPIHISLVERCWDKHRKTMSRNWHKRQEAKNEITEEQAIARLKKSSREFVIRRVIGFDVERFAREQPELYRKYCKYEYV